MTYSVILGMSLLLAACGGDAFVGAGPSGSEAAGAAGTAGGASAAGSAGAGAGAAGASGTAAAGMAGDGAGSGPAGGGGVAGSLAGAAGSPAGPGGTGGGAGGAGGLGGQGGAGGAAGAGGQGGGAGAGGGPGGSGAGGSSAGMAGAPGGTAGAGGTAGGTAGAAGATCGPDYVCDELTALSKKTGLRWKRAPESVGTWQQVATACVAPWRLPTLDELEGIFIMDTSPPLIDKETFPNTPPFAFWSSTSDTLLAWFIDFGNGAHQAVSKTFMHAGRCVTEEAATCGADYVCNAATALSTKTGLRWRRVLEPADTWSGATAGCPKYGPTWRLPTLVEIRTIVDLTAKPPPLVDKLTFPTMPPDATLWTSTVPSGTPSYAWALSFYEDIEKTLPKTTSIPYLCMEGP